MLETIFLKDLLKVSHMLKSSDISTSLITCVSFVINVSPSFDQYNF